MWIRIHISVVGAGFETLKKTLNPDFDPYKYLEKVVLRYQELDPYKNDIDLHHCRLQPLLHTHCVGMPNIKLLVFSPPSAQIHLNFSTHNSGNIRSVSKVSAYILYSYR